MPVRSIFRSSLAGFLAAGLFLLTPARVSAATITITETANPDGSETGLVTAGSTGLDVFEIHPPFFEEIGFHGEWNTTDPGLDALIPGGGSYRLNFQFCENPGPPLACSGFFVPSAANTLADLTPAGITLSGAGWIDSSGAASRFLSDFAITLIDEETAPDTDGTGLVSGVFVPNLSDILQLTFSRLGGTNRISVDGTFESDTVIPEPASLLLLGTGLIGAGLKYRRRRESQA